jgi:hypothetical protein
MEIIDVRKNKENGEIGQCTEAAHGKKFVEPERCMFCHLTC